MKKFYERFVVSLLIFALIWAHAALATAPTPSVNPNIPAQNSALTSAPLRGNFLAIYNDETTLFGLTQPFGVSNAGIVPMTNGAGSTYYLTAAGLWAPIPMTGVTSIGLTMDGVIFNSSVAGSPITTSGIFAPTLATQSANCVLAGPVSGSAATPTCRALIGADIPAPTTSAKGGILALASATAHNVLQYIDTSGIQHLVQLAFSDLSGSLATTQMPAGTGDVSWSAGTTSTTLATVNANPGTAGSASTVAQMTTNGKGLVTAVSSVTITPAAIGSPTDSGTGATGTWPISITGNAATVSTNANLTGPITSSGNVTSVAGAGAGKVFAGATPSMTATPTLGVNATTTGTLGFANGGASGVTTTIEAAQTTTTPWTLNLPSSGGSNGYVLSTNGSGNTSWVAQSGGTITLGTSASAANPQRSGEAGTGFYSDTPNTIEASSGGINSLTLNPSIISLGLGGGTDDCAAIQTLITNSSGETIFTGVPSATYNCPNSGIMIDPSLHTFIGNGATFNAGSMATGPLVTITQANSPPTFKPTNLKNFLQGFNFVGPSSSSTTIDLFVFNTTASQASSAYNIRNITATGFRHKEFYQNGAYLIRVSDFNYGQGTSNGSDIYSPSGYTNSGENIFHDHGSIFQGQLGFDSEANAGSQTFTFDNVSFDNMVENFDVEAGNGIFNNDWFETNCQTQLTGPLFIIGSNTATTVRGSNNYILCDGTGPFSGASSLIQTKGTATTGGSWTWDKTSMHNVALTSGTLGSGAGRVNFTNTTTLDSDSTNQILMPLTNTWANLLSDGAFTQTTIKDFWTITKDTQTITSRTTGTNIVLSMDTGATNCAAASGSTFALSAHKIGVAATAAAFSVFVPVPKAGSVLDSLYYSAPGTPTGSFTIQNYFYNMVGQDGNGLPYNLDNASRTAIDAVNTVTMTGSPISYTQYAKGVGNKNTFPMWANYQQIEFDLTSAPAGYYCIGSAVLGVM